jgi:hypothetical protein
MAACWENSVIVIVDYDMKRSRCPNPSWIEFRNQYKLQKTWDPQPTMKQENSNAGTVQSLQFEQVISNLSSPH